MLKDLVLANRSYRGYDESYKVSHEELMDIIDYARLSPSAKNAQVLKFFIAYEADVVAKIQAETNWAGILSELNLPREGSRPTSFIVILHDSTFDTPLAHTQKDVGIVSAVMTLAATEKGLGCCMIGSYNGNALKEKLNLPDHLTPMLLIAIGKPAEKIVLTEVGEDGSIAYYRDNNDVHYVPKRKLDDVVVFPS